MAAKHSSASRFLQSDLFTALNTFSELESRISALPTNKDRGDAFEVFAEAYLATQKITLAHEVWPFEAMPQEQRRKLSLDTGRDMGVDGTYLTTDGELRAYQVKFRSHRPALTWDELSTFMGLTDQVGQRVLFTNCETLPNLMQDRSGFIPIRGNDLDRLNADDFEAIRLWLDKGKVEIRRKHPWPHQEEALNQIADGLANNDRATVVMACGTGKSLVALWSAEQYNGKTLLVLVPSLALVRQILHEWLRETAWEKFTFLCVCSDPSVTKGADDLIVHQADLDFPVSTDSSIVSAFLNSAFDGVKIIFSTYQSAQVVAAGLPLDAEGKPRAFDLGIFDEAHKTASRDGTRFSFALEDANLPIRKRLFFTATPRHYDVRKKDKDGDSTLVYSMDRPEVYGPVVHTLSFAEAARRGIICDYKVVISVVTSGMVNDQLLRNGEVIVAGDTVHARQVAQQIALQKAVEKYGVSRIFTFHSTVKAARSFTSEDGEGIGQHLPEFTTLHVSGEMPTARREEQMKSFRQAQQAVMSNARCLTEGVDVPAVDMVAFISPRKSKVDIVQATGRAMRRSPGKACGYVMVPLFVEQAADESIEEALKRTGFDDVWDLLGAMREQDDVLVDIVRQMKEDKGRTNSYDESRFNERIEVLGPSLCLETIRSVITTKCLESLGISWDEWFGRLLDFVEREGHSWVPRKYLTNNNFYLGQWVGGQRARKDRLPAERIARLETISDWSWDTHADKWETGYNYLCDFSKREGHCQVPRNYQTSDGLNLGYWIKNQRSNKNRLPIELRQRLELIPGWMWNIFDEKWELGYSRLLMFIESEGHCRVPVNHSTSDGYRLGQWMATQRTSKSKLTNEQIRKLEEIQGWTWNLIDQQWESGISQLLDFLNREGHSDVPQRYITADGYRLGIWVSTQRTNKEDLSTDRKNRLEKIPGWQWIIISDEWNQGYSYLKEYVAREGNCRVKGDYLAENGYRLGQWVTVQRAKKDSLSPERIKLLECIPSWIWSVRDDTWERGFHHLCDYIKKTGHCKVPSKYQTNDGFLLGNWINNQKRKKDNLPSDRISKLEALPQWIWTIRASK